MMGRIDNNKCPKGLVFARTLTLRRLDKLAHMQNSMSRAKKPLLQIVQAALTMTVREAVEEYLESSSRQGNTDLYVADLALWLKNGLKARPRPWEPLTEFVGTTSLAALDKALVNRWLDHVREGTTPKNWIIATKYMKRFLAYQVAEGHLDALPLNVKVAKSAVPEIEVFSQDEMVRLRDCIFRENARDWAIFMLLVDSGIRATELCQLKIGDIRFDRREVHILGKNRKYRIVPLDASLGPLKKYIAVRGEGVKQTPYFFLSFMLGGGAAYKGGAGKKERRSTGKMPLSADPLTRRGLHKLVQRWGGFAEITEARCSPHTFRHYFAVTYLRNGGDVLTLQRILGHSKLQMTERYVRLANTDMQRVHQIASPANDLLPGRLRKLA